MKTLALLLLSLSLVIAMSLACEKPTDPAQRTAHFVAKNGQRCAEVFESERKTSFLFGAPDVPALCKVFSEKDARVCALTKRKLAVLAAEQQIPEPFELSQIKVDRASVLKAGPVTEEDFDHHCYVC